jgi:hypothetical protein
MKEDLEGLAAREVFLDNLNSKDESKKRVKNTKYTAILANQICDYVSKGIPMRQAAQSLGISESTFHRWRRDKEEFSEMIDQAIGVSEARLISEISVNEDWRAKAWILERRFPDRWSKREQIDMNVSKSEGLEEIKLMMKQTDHLLGIDKSKDTDKEDIERD